ncbi:MAG: hypothetical protein M3220_02835 [Chloroflexota bacterium]|nr:hypothetical protein [Chloroflexota bacterium]
MSNQVSKKRRKRIIGVEVRGSGPRALIAATVLQAISDLRKEGPLKEEAQEWLLSPACHYCLDVLEIPYGPFIEALQHRRLQCGTSTRAFWEDAGQDMLDLVA